MSGDKLSPDELDALAQRGFRIIDQSHVEIDGVKVEISGYGANHYFIRISLSDGHQLTGFAPRSKALAPTIRGEETLR